MLITNGTLHQAGMRRRTVQRQVSFGPVTLRIVTIVVFAVAAFIALAQSTASATKNYTATEKESERSQLAQDVEALRADAARFSALSAAMADQATPTPSPTPKLEAPQQINYLPSDMATLDQAVATNAR